MMDKYPRVRPPGKENAPLPDPHQPISPPEQEQMAEPPAPAQPRFEHENEAIIPQGKKFPCGECGAALEYSPGASKLTCRYCGHSQEIPQSAEQVQELSFEAYFEQGEVNEEILEGAELETRCDGCGAQVAMPSHVKSDFCPFCGSQLTNPMEKAKPVMAPGGILPFLIEKNAGEVSFHEWVKSRWFAPNALKEVDRLKKLEGVYVPYWTFDSMTYSFYTGQRGEHYYVTVGSGKNRRRERRTRWYSVSGRVNHFFDDVTICASKSLPGEMVKKLEPWDTKSVVSYDKDFLSGFKTERYQISARQGFDHARVEMDQVIRQLVCQHIGGDVQRISTLNTQHDGVTFKYLLFPLWLAVYHFKDKVYRVFINARTGEIHGERPYSWIKITLASIAAIIAVAIIVAIIVANQ